MKNALSAINSRGTIVGLRMFGKGLMYYGIYNTGTALYGVYEEEILLLLKMNY